MAIILELIPLLGSLVVAASMLASVLFAIWSFRRNAQAQLGAAEAQVQLLALGTLQHYLDLAVAHPELASHGDEHPIDASYAWFAAQALVTAQTLQALVGHQENWQRAINAIVRQHRSYLRSGDFVCDDFTPEFVRYLRERVADLRCAEA